MERMLADVMMAVGMGRKRYRLWWCVPTVKMTAVAVPMIARVTL